MIILEGMDNSGKSKLAVHLSEIFELPLIHSPKDRSNMVNDALTMLVLNPRAVLDRFSVISESIYGLIIRGRIGFDDYNAQWGFYMDRLARCKPLIIYCRPSDEKILDFGEGEQMYGVIANAEELIAAYDAFMTKWRKRFWIYRYDFMALEAHARVETAVRSHLMRRVADEY